MRSLLNILQVPVNCIARTYFFSSNHKQLNFYIILNEGGYACLRPLSPLASGAPQQYNWETSTGGSVE